MNPFNYQETRLILKRLGKTQEDLARDMRVTTSTMNRWLRGKCKPLRVYQKLMEEILNGYEMKEALDGYEEKEAAQNDS